MATKTYTKYVLTGGGTGALDAIDGDELADNYRAIVITDDNVWHYILDASSGETEDGLNIIAPDNNAGTKRWILKNVSGAYSPNYIEADQGVTGDNTTLKYYIDQISSDEATIILRHNSGGTNTEYTLDTNETIPANITLEFERGAIIDGDGTLTINNELSYGDYPIFGSSITIAGGSKFYPDANESDQGVVGDGNTIKNFVDFISSNEATIVLCHNSGGTTTTYDLDTDETIPDNITLKFERGAVLDGVTGDETLTINGGLDVGLYQIFGSSLIVTGSPKIDAAYPEWFGAKGDGTTDDTTAIQAMLDFLVSSTINKGLFGPFVYPITEELTLTDVDGIILQGNGVTPIRAEEETNQTRLLWDDSGSGYMLRFISDTEESAICTGNIVRGINFDGNDTANLVSLERAPFSYFEHCTFYRGLKGIVVRPGDGTLAKAYSSAVVDCMFSDLNDINIDLRDNCHGFAITRSHFSGEGDETRATTIIRIGSEGQCSSVSITDCTIQPLGPDEDDDVNRYTVQHLNGKNFNFIGNYIEGLETWTPILLGNNNGGTLVEGSTISGNRITTSASLDYAILTDNVDGLSITGNYIEGFTEDFCNAHTNTANLHIKGNYSDITSIWEDHPVAVISLGTEGADDATHDLEKVFGTAITNKVSMVADGCIVGIAIRIDGGENQGNITIAESVTGLSELVYLATDNYSHVITYPDRRDHSFSAGDQLYFTAAFSNLGDGTYEVFVDVYILSHII